MQNNQYNPQYYYQQSSQTAAPARSNGGVWIITGVLVGTILVSAIIALAIILIINGPNKNLEYPKAAVVTNVATSGATASPVANTATTPQPSPVIGGTVATSYEITSITHCHPDNP